MNWLSLKTIKTNHSNRFFWIGCSLDNLSQNGVNALLIFLEVYFEMHYLACVTVGFRQE
ncbi:hypothetical protein GNIT_2742 [Glaciecola nitratireducens FR1064]|uniref:Uncharacterized protein n=1 Tax=Glaciecola nitratireducens (strain JCM 12485 / KCTC 12276 / FR1064) TaxID=1085623 RepID=G4QIC5_GLANF|nr:hypothetical protein GNIT_2742 [Glaciecola nitratireducens FR1064]